MPHPRHRCSAHFIIEEFDCHDGTRVPKLHVGALDYLCEQLLEPLRRQFGPCQILSGYRTPTHNREIGGARYSFHCYELHDPDDVAADVRFRRGNIEDWHQAAKAILERKRNAKGGLGYYPQGGFIHIDTRDYIARWSGS